MLNKKKKGQISLSDAPSVVLIVGFVFLVMATIAFIGEKYGDTLADTQPLTASCNHSGNGGTGDVYYGCGTAYNVSSDLQTEISNNTSIAGIVLTISLVGIVLSVLIGIFVLARGNRI
ncbi:MAG: hypothetical protein R6U15_07540 [Candidatus Izemoplasmatales bacterium]